MVLARRGAVGGHGVRDVDDRRDHLLQVGLSPGKGLAAERLPRTRVSAFSRSVGRFDDEHACEHAGPAVASGPPADPARRMLREQSKPPQGGGERRPAADLGAAYGPDRHQPRHDRHRPQPRPPRKGLDQQYSAAAHHHQLCGGVGAEPDHPVAQLAQHPRVSARSGVDPGDPRPRCCLGAHAAPPRPGSRCGCSATTTVTAPAPLAGLLTSSSKSVARVPREL